MKGRLNGRGFFERGNGDGGGCVQEGLSCGVDECAAVFV